jgi:hypothetical protein
MSVRYLTDRMERFFYVYATVGHSNIAISNGLVGYWTFDGPSIDWHTNTVADMSATGNTGTLVSLATSTAPGGGKIGQALNFVRSASQYIKLPTICNCSRRSHFPRGYIIRIFRAAPSTSATTTIPRLRLMNWVVMGGI